LNRLLLPRRLASHRPNESKGSLSSASSAAVAEEWAEWVAVAEEWAEWVAVEWVE
jgi:hypothetical protein